MVCVLYVDEADETDEVEQRGHPSGGGEACSSNMLIIPPAIGRRTRPHRFLPIGLCPYSTSSASRGLVAIMRSIASAGE